MYFPVSLKFCLHDAGLILGAQTCLHLFFCNVSWSSGLRLYKACVDRAETVEKSFPT